MYDERQGAADVTEARAYFSVLGPLEVTRHGNPVPVGPPRLRALLAALLLRANRSVPTGDLVDRIWNEKPPSQPRRTLQLYVVRLRQALGDAQAIRTTPGGYLIQLGPKDLDLFRFEELLDESERTADLLRRVDLMNKGLELWRGPACVDVDSDVLQALDVAPLSERRLQAEERVIEQELSLGRHANQIPRLRRLLNEHPLRERFCAQLMRALYRSGRPAEAVHAYNRTAAVIASELGIEPGTELQDLYEAVLAADSRLLMPSGPAPALQVPAQLPADAVTFTGRAAEVELLLGLPSLAERQPTTFPLAAIDGMAGIGKTALAVHVGHRLARRFPDGQLFVDLHGCSDGLPPMAPGDALDRMLRALGVAGERDSAELDERSALYRSTLANRRMVIVLDNASSNAQVLPLLPGSPGCLVIVTSRRRLTGIDATHRVTLDVLPTADAVAMFTKASGLVRPAEAPHAISEIVELCGRHPLALRDAAAQLLSKPTWTPADLAGKLRRHELPAVHRGLLAAFELSVRLLAADQQRAFRLLRRHPGRHLTPETAAALLHTPVDDASQILDDLADVHLVEEIAHGRYQFHELVRASGLPGSVDPLSRPEDRRRLCTV